MNATTEKPKSQFLTISEAERADTSSVWVLNSSNPKGNINFSVSDGMGGQVVLRVPVTWIPIDLTTQATKATILASPRFRDLLTKKLMQLVSEEYATSVLSQDSAQKEQARLMNYSAEDISSVAVPIEAQVVQSEAMGEISGFAMNLANISADDADEDGLMNTLKGNESTLTKKDMQYIAQNSALPRIKEYAAQRVTEM